MADIRKTVLITGCSPGGIGHAMAREFHSKGFRVFPTARKAESISDLKAMGMEPLSLEVNIPESVKACKKEVERLTGGRLDYLVNNAGRNYTVPALDIDMSEVHSTFETNLFAVMRMCTAFSPLLIRTRGTIVQIGSVAGIIPYVWGSVYNASKAALHLYSATLRVELAPFGVQVITVITGGVKSNIARTHRTLREGSLMEPLADKYARRLKHSQEVGMPTEQYVQDVVRQVLNSRGYLWNTKEIWAGSGGRLVWWVKTLFPEGTWDIYMTREFGLSRLAETQDKKDL